MLDKQQLQYIVILHKTSMQYACINVFTFENCFFVLVLKPADLLFLKFLIISFR